MRNSTFDLMAVSLVSLACLASLAACAGGPERRAGNDGADNPVASSAPPAASPRPETRRALAPAPPTRSLGQFWPTRICARGGVIVVENSCVCDSRMTCSVTRRGSALDLHVGMTQEICKDCGTFSATCAVPAEARPRPGTAKALRITIDGKPALDALELRIDTPTTERCYD